MVNQPNQDMEGLQMPSGRLVLPAPPDQGQYAQTATVPIRSDRPIRHQEPPMPHSFIKNPPAATRRDPAMMVLWFAIALVLVASLVLVAFGVYAFSNNNTTANQKSPTGSNAPGVQPTATTTQQQPTPTPTLQPTATPTATPNTQGALNIAIINIPASVKNNSKVQVTVKTSQPGISVKLQITYSTGVLPTSATSGSHTTNSQGNVILTWSVKLFSFTTQATATVVAVATDKQGHHVESQPVVVAVKIG